MQLVRTRSTFALSLGLACSLALATGCRDGGGGDDDGAEGGTADDSADGGTGGSDADGGSDGTAGDSDSDTDSGGIDTLEPVPGGMRKLMRHEYIGSVDLVLGPDAAAIADPPADVPQEGFDAVGNTILSLASVAIEDYARVSGEVAQAAVDNPAAMAVHVPCVVDGPQNGACYQEVAATLGRLLWRRPLIQAEIDTTVSIAQQGQTEFGTDWNAGLRYGLMALLQSPNFIYIIEVGEPDAEYDFRRLTQLELASRMSFFLLGRTPDGALLDKAEAGELTTDDDIRAEAQSMVESPDARVALSVFFDELYRLRFLDSTPKSATEFPEWTPEIAEFMRQETLLLVHDVVWEQDADFRQVFSADFTYVNDPLAQLYALGPTGTGNMFTKVQWPAGQNRAGFTSQGAFLAHQSTPTRNSPTKRGKYVQQALLCNVIPPPPPDVEAEIPDPVAGQSLREQLEQHMDDPACNTCHLNMDMVGFAFEAFDAIGRARTMDNGVPVDASGDLPNVGSWADAREFGAVLAEHEQTSRCVVNNLVRGRIGHVEQAGEAGSLESLDDRFASAGYSLQNLLVEMTVNPVFRFVDDPK